MISQSKPPYGIYRGRAALWALGLIVMAASVTAFAESYNGLRKWAEAHRVTGMWADIWPLQVDTFIAAGELALLLSALYMWPLRVRVLAWTVSLTGLAVSVICNAGHVGDSASIADHLTAALPPLAAIAGLVIALSVIKQVSLMYPTGEHQAAPEALERPAAEPAAYTALETVPTTEHEALPAAPKTRPATEHETALIVPEPAATEREAAYPPLETAPATEHEALPAAPERRPATEHEVVVDPLLDRYNKLFASR